MVNYYQLFKMLLLLSITYKVFDVCSLRLVAESKLTYRQHLVRPLVAASAFMCCGCLRAACDCCSASTSVQPTGNLAAKASLAVSNAISLCSVLTAVLVSGRVNAKC